MKGRGKYGWFTLFGKRASDGLQVRLGRATSHHVARGVALSILRPTKMWEHIDIMTSTGRRIERVNKPPVEGIGGE